MKPTIYIAGSMHNSPSTAWVHFVEFALLLKGYEVMNPFHNNLSRETAKLKSLLSDSNYEELSNTIKTIAQCNLQKIQKADILILKYDPTIPMIGGIEELIKAAEWGKRVFVYCNAPQDANPYIFKFVNTIYTDWNELFKTLYHEYDDKIDRGRNSRDDDE